MTRVAIITGASRGIGAATALVLAKRGCRVVVNYRASAPEAEEVVAAIAAAGGEAVAIKADVTVPATSPRWSRKPPGGGAGLDALAHNALIPFVVTSFAKLSWEQLGGKLDSEMRAAFLVTKAVVPGMISRGYGRLVYLTTGLSRRPRDGMILLGTAQGGHGPIRAGRRPGAGTARHHRQPGRAGHGGKDPGRASNFRPSGRRELTEATPMGPTRASRRCGQDGGVPGRARTSVSPPATIFRSMGGIAMD